MICSPSIIKLCGCKILIKNDQSISCHAIVTAQKNLWTHHEVRGVLEASQQIIKFPPCFLHDVHFTECIPNPIFSWQNYPFPHPLPLLFSSTPSAQIVSRIIKNHLLSDGGFGSGATQQPFPRMKTNLLERTIIQIAPNNSPFIWGKFFFPSPRHLEPPPTCPLWESL